MLSYGRRTPGRFRALGASAEKTLREAEEKELKSTVSDKATLAVAHASCRGLGVAPNASARRGGSSVPELIDEFAGILFQPRSGAATGKYLTFFSE